MKNIKVLDLKEEDAIKYFSKIYSLFKRIIKNDKKIFEYGFHFDWDNVDKRHIQNLTNDFDEEERDYYFIDKNKCEKYTLDISHDIDNFGYNDEYFKLKYKESYNNLYCCSISAYRNYFEYDDMYLSITFLYDKKEDKIVEILNIEFLNPKIYDNQTIRCLENEETLEKILKKQIKED